MEFTIINNPVEMINAKFNSMILTLEKGFMGIVSEINQIFQNHK